MSPHFVMENDAWLWRNAGFFALGHLAVQSGGCRANFDGLKYLLSIARMRLVQGRSQRRIYFPRMIANGRESEQRR
jgi:hypothetical protein